MAIDRLSLMVELSNISPTQSLVNNFNSFSEVAGFSLAANEDGVFIINQPGDAAGTDIDAYFKLPISDFGIENEKRLRSMYVGYEATGSMLITITPDQDASRERSFTMNPVFNSNEQHGNRIPLRRDLRGRYFQIGFENVSGCDFSIDRIDLIITVLSRKPRGAGAP